jgi:integrase
LLGTPDGLFIQYAQDVFLPDKVGRVKEDTIQTYTIAIGIVNKYLPNLRFDDINRINCNKLERSMRLKPYKSNYINSVFKKFQDCCKCAYIDGVHNNKYYMTDGFVPPPEDVDNVYLTPNELDLLFNHIPNAIPKHKNATAIFLRGCYTGQRYQTYKTLNTELVYSTNNVEMISIKHGKTGVVASIPLSDKMKVVLSVETHPISRQKLSDYIKEVCKIVGIEKWADISSHTARRTFATNMVLAGVDVSKIMKITGHKTEQEFRKYVKIDGVQSAISVIEDVNRVFGII